MGKLLKAAHIGRGAYWRTRRTFGISPGDRHEAMASLRAQLARVGPEFSGTFRLPWGKVEFPRLVTLAAQFEEIFVNRQYAFATASKSPVIVDCGGNLGLSAIWFKQTFPGSQLTVYEPDPELFATFQRNLQRAHISGVAAHNAAVWTRDGRVAFDNRGNDLGHIVTTGGIDVEAVDLARTLPSSVDLLKVDIEGAECAVLDHLCCTRAIDRIKRLVCEFHVTRERTADLLSTLTRLKDAGMTLSMRAAFAAWPGATESESPFEAVDRNNVFMVVYGWKSGSCT